MLVEEQALKDQEVAVKIRGLHVHFNNTTGRREDRVIRAIDGVDLDVFRGEVISLVGESGSGKTTLGRCIVGLTRATSGIVVVNGVELDNRKREDLKRLWKTTQMIFQDPYAAFNPLSTIEDSLTIPLRKFNLAATNAECRDRVQRVLSGVGLDPLDLRGKYPSQLSGGQRQRAAIARALLVEPEVLIADEPVSMLDVSLRAGFLDTIKNLNQSRGLTVIFITHDLAVAQYISDRIAVMYRGKLVEIAPSEELVESPVHPYTVLLLKSVPCLKGEKSWSHTIPLGTVNSRDLHGCSFFPRCPDKGDICIYEKPELKEISDGHYVSCFFRQREG